MAAAITTTATTLEGQLLEVAREIEELENAILEANQSETNQRLTLAVDPATETVTISVALPVTVGGAGGALTFTAAAYLT